ncbi:MAG: cobalt ECF transporter T component CbiQ [Euzebyales bacterium]|nr:cobalt ECF transporter T component CbiQ [Euzebyales bacterium]MBA3621298.1 cobalt ECF transporter T component CbiQ [Euzebyales bacterium]
MGAGHAHALYVHEHSRVHTLAPQVKVAAAFAFVFAVAVTPREAVWAFAVDAAVLAVVVRLARLPWRFVVVRLTVILPFIAFAFLIPFIASGERVEVLGVSVSRVGLWGTWNIVAKAVLGATVSIVLAATTEVPAMLKGLSRLGVPPTLTAIAAFMIRYLELLVAELGRMRTAMTCRGYDPRWLWQTRPIAASAGALFIRSYERGERVHAAMLSRGYTGTMPILDDRAAGVRQWLAAATVPLVAATAAVAALTVGG